MTTKNPTVKELLTKTEADQQEILSELSDIKSELGTPQPAPQPATPPVSTPSNISKAMGVNESGAEFGTDQYGANAWGAKIGTSYVYTTDISVFKYYVAKGLKVFRLPLRMEYLWKDVGTKMADADKAGVKGMLDAVAAAGGVAIIDFHNYEMYYGTSITTGSKNGQSLSDFYNACWLEFVQTFGTHPAIYGYELMNEPISPSETAWNALQQRVINTIRTVDKTHYIIAAGVSYQSAERWAQVNPTIQNLVDPANKLMYGAHCYFDDDSSGQYNSAYPGIAHDQERLQRAQNFIDWCSKYNKVGIFTEYGIPANDPNWNALLDKFLKLIYGSSVIAGGTYWAGGIWWGSYTLSVEPINGSDKLGINTLKNYPTK